MHPAGQKFPIFFQIIFLIICSLRQDSLIGEPNVTTSSLDMIFGHLFLNKYFLKLTYCAAYLWSLLENKFDNFLFFNCSFLSSLTMFQGLGKLSFSY